MSRDYLIGVDLGTSVIKTTLFDLNGLALADATRDAPLHQPRPGLAEQSGDAFYKATLDTLREVIEKTNISPKGVAAIAFDGQMAGAIAIDRDWNALTPWYPSALDIRYQPYLTQVQEKLGDRLLQLGGALPYMAPRMVWWKEEYPDLYKRIHKVLILSNYVAGRLASLSSDDAFVDPSYLTWIGLADTANRSWSAELIDAFGVSEDKLPRIVPATSVIGRLNPTAASACGLIAGIPLVAGAGDQVAGFIGAGLVESGQLVDVSGTFPVLASALHEYQADTRYQMLQPLAGPISENNWYSMMYISGGGLTHRWFRDQFAVEEIKEAQELGEAAYQFLDAKAALVPPGSEGLLFIPHLAGRACPSDPAVRGAWLGFTWTHEKAHFYRAVLESIAYDYAQALKIVREYSPEVQFSEVRVIGGGAHSDLWNQIKSDVLGVPYVKLQREDVAALGCAVMAGHAVGAYPDISSTASQFSQTTSHIEPDSARYDFYQAYVQAYIRAFDELRSVYETLSGLQESPFVIDEEKEGFMVVD